MSSMNPTALSRRAALLAGAAGLTIPTWCTAPAAAEPRAFALRAAPARTRLTSPGYGDTAVWCYDGTVPGPEIRVRQGERLRIAIENGLAEPTTVHWHGLRVPNAMDGVADLTQPPIAPGGRFVYAFDALDAGTFWYHPHQRSFEQVGRGLYGPLIVEEPEPPAVDRELVWVLDDWRLGADAEIRDDFGNFHDVSHAGRIGDTVTINGRVPDSVAVRSGERARLRLINAANARIFALDFQDHAPVVIALDGQPVTPHAPAGGRVVLGPAMRADLILNMTGAPSSRAAVVDRFYDRGAYRLVELAYATTPLRAHAPTGAVALPANPLAEPDLGAARRHEVVFEGGMMGGMMRDGGTAGLGGGMMGGGGMAGMGGGMMGGMMRDGGPAGRMMGGMMNMMHVDGVWFINGKAAEGHVLEPMLTLERGRTHVLAMTNATAFHHPIHLHGHSFRVITRDGAATRHREWRDTVLMAPRERVEIALVADNPGDWMFHCHILEHMAGGMMGVIRVA